MSAFVSNGRRVLHPEEETPLVGGKNLPENGPTMTTKARSKEKVHRRSTKERCITIGAIGASVLALVLCASMLGAALLGGWGGDNDSKTTSNPIQKKRDTTAALYDDLGRYVMEDYDTLPPFSDFLPALAGYYGKPLYAFYVNRGQGIASFGVKSKDFPILEFYPANKAYQNTPLLGFRTFLQGSRKGSQFLIEPFSSLKTRFRGMDNNKDSHLPKRYMYIGSNEMQLQETDKIHGIEVNTTFFILPEEDFGAFVKRTKITNIASSSLTFSMLDGLAMMEPAGGEMFKLLKGMSRTLEGWMGVYSPYENTYTMPFYRLSTEPGDKASVVVQKAGHWCLSLIESDTGDVLPIVYDRSKVFGEDTTMLHPVGLYSTSISDIVQGPQYGKAKTSSAFAAVENKVLAPGESLTISTFFGKADDVLDIPVIARTLLGPGFCEYKAMRTREVIKQITAAVETKTSNTLFDGHVQQMFLDNSLRGGIPSILGDVDDDAKMRNSDEDPRLKVYHLFSRVHGDLERDYNDFVIEPTFFSEGPGNFRDIVQNRRSDVLFNPRVGSFNINTLLSFIQADGYNPLKIEAVSFTISDIEACKDIAARAVGRADGHRAQREALTGILNSGPFRPGQLFLLIEQQNIELIMTRQDFIDMVAAAAEAHPMAVYNSGFWADHWTYLMEHIESYLSIYPDWEERIMYDEELPYYFSPAFVKPRSEKYVLSTSFDGIHKHVRQLDATIEDKEEKRYQRQFILNSTGWYSLEANWTHDADGAIFISSPIAKLFLLGTIKFATRDAYGMGIEYEGGKPGWDDANNGLVGMLGSGMPETYELSVLLRYVLSLVSRVRRPIHVPAELGDLLGKIDEALLELSVEYDDSNVDTLEFAVPAALFRYWDTVSTAREEYRTKTKLTFEGSTSTLHPFELIATLNSWLAEIDRGIQRAMKFGTQGHRDDGMNDITPTYFSYQVSKWKRTGDVSKKGHPLVTAKEMKVSRFPLFLEGPTRMMKTVDSMTGKDIYNKVRVSPLRDDGLGMYLISASLEGQSFDMGREMAFAPGWLENESVWLHMSYKFYLQMLQHGLYDEFFEEMTTGGLLPFMDSEVYGRSLMECSSFIASSAFEDPAVRGRGFLPRLSGSTAEFLSMWVLMMIGPKPFYFNQNQLEMRLVPALPRWLFNEESEIPTISFKLFGSIDVTYYHKRGAENLYGVPPSRYVIVFRDGSMFNVDGPSIPNDLADKIRRVVFVASIDAYFE